MPEVSNPTPNYTFDDVFSKLVDTTATLGGNYLTIQGQVAVAKAAADAQARLNGYSAVNPSLGAVNPAAAAATAGKTLTQKWLPNGSPVIGAPASGSPQASPAAMSTMKIILIVIAVLIGGLIVWKLIRK